MEAVLDKDVAGSLKPGLNGLSLGLASSSSDAATRSSPRTACFHCGEPCPDLTLAKQDKLFCCQGCLFVHELLTESGLDQFYGLARHPGVRVEIGKRDRDWAYLDEPALQGKLLDFTDGKSSRITFHVPAIHCVACVWLLENLFRLLPGVGKSQVNFPRREVAIHFSPEEVKLSQVVNLLSSMGYEPELNFGQVEKKKARSSTRKIWLQIGLAGFAFGNIMLFSLPTYLGLDHFSGPAFKSLFGYLSLLLAAPVLVYSASDYWRSAWLSLRQRRLTLEVPIALGLAALYARSIFEVSSGLGEGYADSLAGLIFFLLIGRAFQQKTHQRLAFDRDYKSFFPLSVTRRTDRRDENIALENLQVGDRLFLRNGELIPADSKLLSGVALVDYSFVTGESEPVEKKPGEHLYAGGQQAGGAIEVETVKPVSQSYLTSLWNHEAFRKVRTDDLNTLTNRYSGRFTKLVIAIACLAALFWVLAGDSGRGVRAFTAILIVACPCALALAAPFGLGTAQRLLGTIRVYLKNVLVLERLAEVDSIVFDKTGTLTTLQSHQVAFHNDVGALTPRESSWVQALAAHSTHPYARQIAAKLRATSNSELAVSDFNEVPGAGVLARVDGHALLLGSRSWLARHSIPVPELALPSGSTSFLAIDGLCRGAFVLSNNLRPQTDQLFVELAIRYQVALLSGDNERERGRFVELLGPGAEMRFNQSPMDKLRYVQDLQQAGRKVMMVGDGLNDAGALRQSEVGVAVVEKIGIFSPASDIILEASQVAQLVRILDFAHASTRIVRGCFGISALYNLVGVSIAAAGVLSPLICAVLMPLSSLTVVIFACGMTSWAAQRAGLPVLHSEFPD
jgi:P-type Cu+ transporter